MSHEDLCWAVFKVWLWALADVWSIASKQLGQCLDNFSKERAREFAIYLLVHVKNSSIDTI